MIEVQHPPTPTIDRLIAETMRLATNAQYVISCIEGGLDVVDDNLTRIDAVKECTQITARLTAVMSWLLLQKAAAAGEYAADDERLSARLFGAGDPRLDPDLIDQRPIVDAVAGLMNDTAHLYERVARLDRELAQADKERK